MPANNQRPQASEDGVKRAADQIASRLRALGVTLSGSETPEELVEVEETIERFEEAVQARGGDLMVDEPPPRGVAAPDDKHFLLPRRNIGESIAAYIEQLESAIDRVHHHRSID